MLLDDLSRKARRGRRKGLGGKEKKRKRRKRNRRRGSEGEREGEKPRRKDRRREKVTYTNSGHLKCFEIILLDQNSLSLVVLCHN